MGLEETAGAELQDRADHWRVSRCRCVVVPACRIVQGGASLGAGSADFVDRAWPCCRLSQGNAAGRLRDMQRRSVILGVGAAALAGSSRARAQAPVVIKFSHVVADDTPKGMGSLRFKELAHQFEHRTH